MSVLPLAVMFNDNLKLLIEIMGLHFMPEVQVLWIAVTYFYQN